MVLPLSVAAGRGIFFDIPGKIRYNIKVIGVAAGLELARAEAAKSTEAESDTERKGA